MGMENLMVEIIKGGCDNNVSYIIPFVGRSVTI
jgi:hypothetical protein